MTSARRSALVSGVSTAMFAMLTACGSDTPSTVDAPSTMTDAEVAPDAGAALTDSEVAADGAPASDAVVGIGEAGTASDCLAAMTNIDKVICAAEGFLASLPGDQLALAQLPFTDAVSRTKWSNLPGTARAGVKMGSLSEASQTLALTMMAVVLSSTGKADLDGVRAADDYLNSLGGSAGPGGGGAYGASNYVVSVLGTPSTTGSWAVMFGGHHMAFTVTYVAGVGYPVPNHLGVEPKAAFTINGSSYAPMAEEGGAMLAVFHSLSSSTLASAYLAGQTYSDVLIGPVEYGTGSSAAAKAKYPVGANRTGVLVGSLTAEQQAQVTSAIAQWVGDFDPAVADELLAAYTSADAYADTYIAWGGTQASGVDPDVNGTYMRIDGPRVWIEVSCQAGVVVQGKTHYHSIYRDKQFDYGATL